MQKYSLKHLSNDSLVAQTGRLVAGERETTAELLAHLAEVDERGLYRPKAYPSMFAWCVGELGFSEDMAARRIHVARAARRFPILFEAIADGRLHLTAVNLLEPHLTAANLEEWIRLASHRTKAQIEQLLADRCPEPDVPTTLRALPLSAAESPAPDACAQSPAPARVDVAVPAPTACANSPAPARVDVAVPALAARADSPAPARVNVAAAPPDPMRSQIAPLGGQRFALHATISQDTHDQLRRAQDLIGPAVKSSDLDTLLGRALGLLLKQLERRKCGATTKSRTPGTPRATGVQGTSRPSNSRHIPAEVRRQVWARDGGRCTFTSETGRRCECRRGLEFDHVIPVARGGESTAGNLRLRCRAHNQLEAEREFGEGFMAAKRSGRTAPGISGSIATNPRGIVTSSP